MKEYADWSFPLPRPHCGMLQGNARMGVMIWGGGNTLRITIGRSDLWDHRGGMEWSPEHNFKNIRALLEANDEAGIRTLFNTKTEKNPDQPNRPSIIPVGQIELRLPQGISLRAGRLFFASGRIDLTVAFEAGEECLSCELSMKDDLFLLQLPQKWGKRITIIDHPAWETVGGALQEISFVPPVTIREDEVSGWWQALPVDAGISVTHRLCEDTLLLMTARVTTASEIAVVVDKLAAQTMDTTAGQRRDNATWWSEYWRDVPEVYLPNSRLQFLYQYGMYKFAGMSQPDGVAAGLQGPWIEDYQLPPWSSDYHFNINVQMCYWPAYRGNRLAHLRPLFDLILSWEDTLRDIARKFAGVDDGRMLPHAVDDHCVAMGGFWTGMIDHGCTAWVAQMMYDYARFLPDPIFLREKALPFMRGTFRVFAAMLEETNGRYSLPVSVSPEYGGANMNAWGRNASFQLAALHRLCENLIEGSRQLGLASDPLWQQVHEGLPAVSETEDGHIGLWDGKDLDESHRHHAHLGGLYPFDSLDLNKPEIRTLLRQSFQHWIFRGMGLWTGWCMPWAAILHARSGNGDMAEQTLEIWQKVFTNQGHGTLHDCNFPGLSLMGARPPFMQISDDAQQKKEVMQMDAGMGVTGAILEMLVMEMRGIHYIFRGVPTNWCDCTFSGLRAAGGFLIDAERRNGQFIRLAVRATAAGSITIANPCCPQIIPGLPIPDGLIVEVRTPGGLQRTAEALITLHLQRGESIEICAL